jgi:hypothetical protein
LFVTTNSAITKICLYKICKVYGIPGDELWALRYI